MGRGRGGADPRPGPNRRPPPRERPRRARGAGRHPAFASLSQRPLMQRASEFAARAQEGCETLGRAVRRDLQWPSPRPVTLAPSGRPALRRVRCERVFRERGPDTSRYCSAQECRSTPGAGSFETASAAGDCPAPPGEKHCVNSGSPADADAMNRQTVDTFLELLEVASQHRRSEPASERPRGRVP